MSDTVSLPIEDSGPVIRRATLIPAHFCISMLFQRHSYYVLKNVSVFYFGSILLSSNRGLNYYTFFFAALYLAPVCVGALVTTVPAQRQAVYWGQLLLMVAFAVLAFGGNRYFAGTLLISGVGFFNVSFKTVFGASMRHLNADLDGWFTWLYVAVNIGSFFASWVLSDLLHYKPPAAPGSLVFAWCGACMAVSFCFWWIADRSIRLEAPPATVPIRHDAVGDSPAANATFFGPLIVTLFAILFWLGLELRPGTLNLYATDPSKVRQILLGFNFPGLKLQSVTPFVIVLLGFGFASLWQALARRNRDPHPVIKMSLGLFSLGIGFFVLAAGLRFSHGRAISPAWFIWMYVWHSVGELFSEPIGQAFVIANTAANKKALFLAIWDAADALAIIGALFASTIFGDHLFILLGAFALIAGAVLVFLESSLKQLSVGHT